MNIPYTLGCWETTPDINFSQIMRKRFIIYGSIFDCMEQEPDAGLFYIYYS